MKFVELNEHYVNIKSIESISKTISSKEFDLSSKPRIVETGKYGFTVKTMSGDSFYQEFDSCSDSEKNRKELLDFLKIKND